MTISFIKKAVIRRMRKVILAPIKACNTIYYLLSDKKKTLVVNASVFQFLSCTRHYNLGDDLNIYLLKELTGKKIFVNNQFYHKPIYNIMCIGSVIDWLSNDYTSIWGAGIIEPSLEKNSVSRLKKATVLAVRGKFTRNILLQNGINCPKVFGDPALLLPYIYSPKVKIVKDRIGFIPHFYDKNDSNLIRLLQEHRSNTILIKIQGYKNWKETINEILSCEFIVSSSLHGLILSDAYEVPNLWVSFSDRLKGGTFKFKDYYSAVGKETNEYVISDKTSINDLLNERENFTKIHFDPKPLMGVCPFPIVHPEIRKIMELAE